MASAATTESTPFMLYKEMQNYHDNTVEPFTIELRQEDDDRTRQDHDDSTRIDDDTHVIILQITKATTNNASGIITLEGFGAREEGADENPLPYRLYIGEYVDTIYLQYLRAKPCLAKRDNPLPDLKYVAVF